MQIDLKLIITLDNGTILELTEKERKELFDKLKQFEVKEQVFIPYSNNVITYPINLPSTDYPAPIFPVVTCITHANR